MEISSEPQAPSPQLSTGTRDSRRPRTRVLWVAGAVLAVAALAVAGTVVSVHARDAATHPGLQTNTYGQFIDPAAAAWSAHPAVRTATGTEVHIVAGSPTCIDDWHGGVSGSYTFDALNDEGDDMEIYLQDTTSKKIYTEFENFGINATRQVTGVIPPGSYQWVCITAYTIKSSKPFTVTGSAPMQPVAGVVPVSPLDLRVPINTYTAWVQGQLPGLTRQVKQLAAAVHAGNLAAAKRDWLAAHTTYETLGAAYGAFGPLDTAINGNPASDVSATSDPKLTGFRKIEALLWSGASAARIAPYADGLVANVGKLSAQLALPNAITPLDMGTRAHEILEDTLGTDLNGIGDAGSHTELATVDANITGTFEALKPLAPILTKQDPWLGQTESWLHQLQRLVERYRTASGWEPLASLTTAQRAELNAQVQQAVELLSHIPPILEPRDNPDEEGGVGLVSGSDTGGTSK